MLVVPVVLKNRKEWAIPFFGTIVGKIKLLETQSIKSVQTTYVNRKNALAENNTLGLTCSKQRKERGGVSSR